MSRGKSTSSLVWTVLTEHPREVLTIDRIAADTGLNVKQVQSAMYNIIRAGGDGARAIEVQTRGRAWTYDPRRAQEPKSEKICLEEISRTAKGDVICRGSDELIYVARVIDGFIK